MCIRDRSYTWIGIDELTQYPTEFPLQYLQSRLRTTNPAIQCYIRCTANPGGVGGHWVKKSYLDPSPPNESISGEDKITSKFIKAIRLACLHFTLYISLIK